MIWLVGSLLLSACISPALGGNVGNGVVEDIIAKSNQYCRENNITTIELEAFTETPVEFGRGWLSGLDNLENAWEPSVFSREYGDGLRYYYTVGITMNSMQVNYPFKISLPGDNTSGIFSIDVGKGVYHTDGHVDVAKDGTCEAVLENVYLYKMENSKGHIDSKDIPAPEIRELYENIINELLKEEVDRQITDCFLDLLTTKKLKEVINNIVCSTI